MSGTRLPFDALRAEVGHDTLDVVVAERLRVSRRQVVRWAAEGMTVASAEQVCELLRVHPGSVWGAAWWEHVRPDGRLLSRVSA